MRGDEVLADWGAKLVDESQALRKDLAASYARSMLDDGEPVLPAIAGVSTDAASRRASSYR